MPPNQTPATLKPMEKQLTVKNRAPIRRRINANREVIEQNRLRLGQERRLRKQLIKTLDTIFRVAQREYMKNGSVQNTEAGIDERLRKVLESHYRQTIIMFGERSEEGATKRTRFQGHIDDFIATDGGAKITAVSETTRKQVNRIVAAGQAEGASVDQIARQLRKQVGLSANRAHTIARTETHNAALFANDAIDRENRGDEVTDRVKRWVSVSDSRTRSHHARMNGEQVAVDDDFQVPYKGNIYSMQRPGDSAGGAGNVINCRCVVVYIDDETETTQDNIITNGTEPYKRWGKDPKGREHNYHQEAWFHDLPEDLRTAIQNKAPLDAVYFDVNDGGSYNRAFGGTIIVFGAPGETLPSLLKFYQRVWRHEYAHHLDVIKDADGKFKGLWSERVVGEMIEDAALYTDDFIANAEKLAAKELQELTAKGVFEFRNQVKISTINKQLAGTGLNSRDLLRMFEHLQDVKGSTARRGVAQELMRIATLIKHKDYRSLEKAFRRHNGQDGDWFAVNDFMEAVTDTKLGRGHGTAYYHRGDALKDPRNTAGYTDDHTAEAFAEYVALTGGRNRDTWTKVLKYLAPKTTEGFRKTLSEIAKAG